MSFELQYVLSFGICMFLFVWAWYRLIDSTESNALSQVIACEYCSNVAVTTCYESDIEQEVSVCQNHIDQFVN